MENYLDKLLNISDENEFNSLCLEVFQFQYDSIELYKNFVDLIKPNLKSIHHYTEIPFLPIEFFKTHKIISKNQKHKLLFKSSGTSGGLRSNHYICDETIYQKNSLVNFNYQFGNVEEFVFLGLLPSYIENGESSLVYMVDYFMKRSNRPENGFYLYDFQKLHQTLQELEKRKQKTILFGVSYALLDFSERFPIDLEYTKIIETGGMKGRKKELPKPKLISILKKNFNTKHIYSEYGMTELLSQSYTDENGTYNSPTWKKILIRQTDDPLSLEENGKQGGMNIIDLANVYSCSFIATQDLGRTTKNGFLINGRIDNTDIRGCSLLYR